MTFNSFWVASRASGKVCPRCGINFQFFLSCIYPHYFVHFVMHLIGALSILSELHLQAPLQPLVCRLSTFQFFLSCIACTLHIATTHGCCVYFQFFLSCIILWPSRFLYPGGCLSILSELHLQKYFPEKSENSIHLSILSELHLETSCGQSTSAIGLLSILSELHPSYVLQVCKPGVCTFNSFWVASYILAREGEYSNELSILSELHLRSSRGWLRRCAGLCFQFFLSCIFIDPNTWAGTPDILTFQFFLSCIECVDTRRANKPEFPELSILSELHRFTRWSASNSDRLWLSILSELHQLHYYS